jgi:glycosyltransferase involved in cell wall biosynthesis
MIFEVDDPIFLDDDTGIVNSRIEKRLRIHLRTVDDVIVDNPSLAEYCRKYNSSVHVVVSCVETNVYKPATTIKDNQQFVIGWVGQPSTLIYLDDIERPLRTLHERYGPRLSFKIVSSKPYSSAAYPVTNKMWRLEDEPDDIRSFNVGIVPLRDYSWTTYKMAYRPYLYMACGIPVILSSVGPSFSVLEHGKEGFFARTEEDWYDGLATLIENPELGSQIGSRGLEKVLYHYSYERNFPDFLEILSTSV